MGQKKEEDLGSQSSFGALYPRDNLFHASNAYLFIWSDWISHALLVKGNRRISFKEKLNQLSFFIHSPPPPHRGPFNLALHWKAHFSPRWGTAALFDHSVELRTLCSKQFIFSSRSKGKLKRKIFAFSLPTPGFLHTPNPNARPNTFK